jgi:hypothetical protein
MADTLTITLPAPLADEVRAAAEARGMTPDDYVRAQLAEDIAFENSDLGWGEDERRMNEPGENIPLDVAMDELEARIAAKRAAE